MSIVNTPLHSHEKNNDHMELKEWLKAEMGARGINPSELARTSKVPQPTIFRILSGETKDPRAGTLRKLERALGVRSPSTLAATGPDQVMADFLDAYTQADETGRKILRATIDAVRHSSKTSASEDTKEA